MTTSWSSTVTPPSLKTARRRTRKRSWWRRSWWKRMPRSRSNSSIRLLHCLADVFCRNLKYALIWFFSKPQDPFVISQYHYVIQLLHICNQQSDMMHEDQAKQRRGGTERRLLICTYIWKYLNLTNGLMPIEQRKFLHRKYILKKKKLKSWPKHWCPGMTDWVKNQCSGFENLICCCFLLVLALWRAQE